ncbi:hypothetical protein [Streptomyces lydicus]|uniref:hypothetical protein n=1 Tax=Streptomyces lydicus TaxID=47763 RepID=UPI001010F7C7|nr:hypothetical protein [Streptomyces lydicus]MCZ1006878.1 hypothetical protein [Streptomyces lydicus]
MDDDAAEFRTMFIFSPPEGAPQGWGLTFPSFTDALRTKEPGAVMETWSGQYTGETLSFQFGTSVGDTAEGMVGVEPNGVAIEDCTAAEAADFAAWLQQAIVPAGSGLMVNIREGVEWELPLVELRSGTVNELEECLVGHVDRVLRYEEEQLG